MSEHPKLPQLVRAAAATEFLRSYGLKEKEAEKILQYLLTQPEAIWRTPIPGKRRPRAYYRREALLKIMHC